MTKEVALEKYNKESQDVVDSIANISDTLKKLVLKKQKIANASTKEQRKLYLGQAKQTEKYLDSMFTALRLEMIERAKAEINLERIKQDEQR